MEKRVLTGAAQKLGIAAPSVIRKAEEYLRLCEVKSSSGGITALNLSGSCKAVLCLELASTSAGQTLDKTRAIQVAGVTRKIYLNGLKTMERILDLQPNTSIRELAVQFGCTPATELAQQILQRYHTEQYQGDTTEVSQAFLKSAALFTACRCQKIKVDKKKLLELSGVKRSTLDRMVSQMEKIAEKIKVNMKGVTSKKQSTASFLEELEKSLKEGEDHTSNRSRSDETVTAETEDDFEEWREKILQQAYKALSST